MEITTIPYSETNYFSKTVEKYLNQNDALKAFYGEFPTKKNLLNSAKRKDFCTEQRTALLNVLNQQHDGNLSPKQKENLTLLADEKAFTITTGHQICLFGGPLYFFLKIISAINVAKELNNNDEGLKFVPLFWMATEDHDFEEVNHVHLFGKKIEWQRPFGAHVGDMGLESIEKFKTELFAVLGNSQNADKLKEIFEKAYAPERTLSQASRIFIDHFFAEHGLLVLDANNKTLKSAFVEVMLDDIEKNSTQKLVEETNERLKNEIKVQANPSEINLFCLGEKRMKIRKENDSFRIGEERVDLQTLLTRVKNEPEKFSPNVLLRPLYQEFTLPNIAYVGGGGELAYWLELKSLFERHNVQYPSLILRNSLLWIDKGSAKKMKSLPLSISDVFQREEDLVKSFSRELLSKTIDFESEKEQLNSIFSGFTEKMKSVDASLENSALGEQKNVLKSIGKLEAKLLKAVKAKNEVQITQVKKIKNKLFPYAGLQERKENFASIYLTHGRGFIDVLLEKLDPFAFEFSVIKEEA